MYANSYDDGRLMKSYIRWSERLARLHQRTLRIYQEAQNMRREDEESEEVKADEESCSKCKGDNVDPEENANTFPHIQDLCPADRRRIAQLVKQLIKCTKEMRDAKSELVISQSEKEAMKTQYQLSLDRRETEKKQLELELCQVRTETRELKSRISRALELVTGQIAAHEKQFIDLSETVRDLAKQKTRLENTLAQKQLEATALEGKLRRTMEVLEMEKLLHSKKRGKDANEMVHQACQTQGGSFEIFKNTDSEAEVLVSNRAHAKHVKSKEDLDKISVEEILIRDLFFRKPSVEESGTLDILPVLSETGF